MQATSDVLVVGGGVIGLSIAYQLAGQGKSVCVLEQGQFGQEASWAGAGILPPGNLEVATTPEARLRSLSHAMWPEWSSRLREETGIDSGYLNCGGIGIAWDAQTGELDGEIDRWRNEGVTVEQLTPQRLVSLEPELSTEIAASFRLPQLSQVRNPRHLKSLIAACRLRGVELRTGERVTDILESDRRITGVRTVTGDYSAETVCVAGGAWSAELLRRIGVSTGIVPVRGQIVLLSLKFPVIRHIIEHGPRYVVPRPDGRVLIGSTQEHVGFDKRNTAAAVADLIEFGTRLVPSLAEATLERTWAGLRPNSPRGLPFLGPVPGFDSLFIAAGHFRAGLQMSPGTAVVMANLISGSKPPIPIKAFQI